MYYIIISLIVGILFGYFVNIKKAFIRTSAYIQNVLVWLLIFSIGITIGSNDKVLKNLATIGISGLVFATLCVFFSILTLTLFVHLFLNESKKSNKKEHKKTSIKISYSQFVSLFLGIISGRIIKSITFDIDLITIILLNVLILLIGLEIGLNKDIISKIKTYTKQILITVSATVLGSFVGGCLSGIILKIPQKTSLAIASGMGWYSLSSIMITDIAGAKMGLIAFLSNVFREILAFVLIPIIAVKLGNLEAIAPSGATSMDTTLPIIHANTNYDTSVIAIANGIILSSLVPLLVTLFIG